MPFRIIRQQTAIEEIQNLGREARQNDQGFTRRPTSLHRNTFAGANPSPQSQQIASTGQVFDARRFAARPPPASGRGSPNNFGTTRAPQNFSGISRGRGGSLRGRGGGRGGGTGRREGSRAPRGQRRRGRGGDNNGGSGREDWKHELTAHETQFLKELEVQQKPQESNFEPQEINPNTLDGASPLLLTGILGQREDIHDALRRVTPAGVDDDAAREHNLVKQLLRGDLVFFRSDAERDAVSRLAPIVAARGAAARSEQKGELIEPVNTTIQTPSQEQIDSLTESMARGDYKLKEENAGELMQLLLRYARKNKTYGEKEEELLVKTVRRLMPSTKRISKGAQAKTTSATI